jgi:hypothetical protein
VLELSASTPSELRPAETSTRYGSFESSPLGPSSEDEDPVDPHAVAVSKRVAPATMESIRLRIIICPIEPSKSHVLTSLSISVYALVSTIVALTAI